VPRRPSVLIVGGGPAGLSAAIYLKQKGYQRVTVLEKQAQVGGKCLSLEHGDTAYDLGANLTTPRYDVVRGLAQHLGLTPRPLAERRVISLTDAPAPSLDAQGPLAPLVVRGGALFYLLARAPTGVSEDGYLATTPGVRQPFGDWLRRNGLARFREVFANLFIAYGYGVMDDLPAAYALKFFDRVHLDTSVDVLVGKETDTTTDFVEGYQALWTRAVDHYGLEVIPNASIQRINRSPRTISARWTDADGAVHRGRWQRLVLACPLQHTPDFLDTSSREQRLFEKIRTNTYYVTAARVTGLPPQGTYLFPYSSQLSPGWPTVYYQPVPDDPNGVFMFYAYGGPGIDEDVVRKRLTTTLAQLGAQVDAFLLTKKWNYFPHVSADEMQAGFYEELESLQGTWNTWYAGEVLSFTLVELVVRYSRALVDRHF